MKLEQLEQVVEVAKTGSISKAATNLLLSQPGLSTSIKQLECELEADLFIRTKKGVELTEVGSSFVEYAKRILEQVNNLGKLGKKTNSDAVQTLSVAHGHFRYASVVMAMLMNKHKDDGSRFVMRNGINADVIDWVSDGICDIGLITVSDISSFKQLTKFKELQYQVVYSPSPKVIIGTGHPLFYSPRTEVSIDEISKYPQVSYDETAAKNYFRSVYLQTNSDNLRMIVTDRASLYEMLEFTPCYSFGFSNDIVYGNIPRQQKTRTLQIISNSRKQYHVVYVTSANMESLPLAKEYIELLTDVCTRENFWELHPDITIDPSKQP